MGTCDCREQGELTASQRGFAAARMVNTLVTSKFDRPGIVDRRQQGDRERRLQGFGLRDRFAALDCGLTWDIREF